MLIVRGSSRRGDHCINYSCHNGVTYSNWNYRVSDIVTVIESTQCWWASRTQTETLTGSVSIWVRSN